MRICYYLVWFIAILATSAFAGVTVTKPSNGSTVGSPVNYVATATTSCSKGVASMGIYINDVLTYVVNGASLNTSLSFNPGTYSTVVEEWDYCGGASYTPIAITVTNKTGVWVTAPANNGTVTSPVNYVATATDFTCSKGVASMGVYINNVLSYAVNGASLNTYITFSPGTYNTVVEEWNYCGGASYTPITIIVPNKTGVWVTSPTNNGTFSSPVSYVATATDFTCSKGVASMGIYINNALQYVVNGASMNTSLSLNPGTYNTVVEEWNYCGGASYTSMTITVGGTTEPTLKNLQASGGWVGYGELPPDYSICTSCGPGVTWSMEQHITSPSLSGNSTQFNIGGTTPYADVLFTNPLIGQNSSQGLPDTNHTLLPTLYNFIYDGYFYSTDISISQVMEFDISMYFDGLGLIWGNQCRIAGGNEWDIWNNVDAKWVSTGFSCNPISNGWNHVTIQVQRESDNWLLFQSITLNGVTNTINQYYAPGTAPSGWWGITVNYQMDGNYKQSPYTTYLDNFSFSYW